MNNAYIKIKRKTDENKDYYETFLYEGDVNSSIALVLEDLNSQKELKDINGDKTSKISWECGCLQRKCGACAMVINGKPRLACSSFLKDLLNKDSEVILEPLSKFNVIHDLKVDRSVLFENMKNMKIWLDDEAEISLKSLESQYQSSRCLMCGCCLEICPNFIENGNFYGTVSMVNIFKLIKQNPNNNHKKELIDNYKKYYYEKCGKALSCHDICPLKLPIEELLVETNSTAVWGKNNMNK
jgi:succinate dehydrogenase / fumarate reductase iron-sulfur subunit